MKPILQIEDDQNDIFLLCHAMRKAGDEHVLHVLTDGQEAIDVQVLVSLPHTSATRR